MISELATQLKVLPHLLGSLRVARSFFFQKTSVQAPFCNRTYDTLWGPEHSESGFGANWVLYCRFRHYRCVSDDEGSML